MPTDWRGFTRCWSSEALLEDDEADEGEGEELHRSNGGGEIGELFFSIAGSIGWAICEIVAILQSFVISL